MRRVLLPLALIAAALTVPTVSAAAPADIAIERANGQAVVDFWTPERRASAISRDITVQPNGDSFVRVPGGWEHIGNVASAFDGKGKNGPSSLAADLSSTSGATLAGSTTQVPTAVGRIYFVMGNTAYVCSGAVISDSSTNNYSVILTAAHCVESERSGSPKFASRVLFVPQQQISQTKTDRNCNNDEFGCWVPDAAFVNTKWTSTGWSNNIPWDYGFYRVPTTGRHYAANTKYSDSLELAVSPLTANFSFANSSTTYGWAFGYSYSADPLLQYCSQDTVNETSYANNWWLPNCGLTGGASGGPWLQGSSASSFSTSVFSVNSWGFSGQPGMAGPRLSNGASAVYDAALGSTACTNGAIGSGVRCTVSISKP